MEDIDAEQVEEVQEIIEDEEEVVEQETGGEAAIEQKFPAKKQLDSLQREIHNLERERHRTQLQLTARRGSVESNDTPHGSTPGSSLRGFKRAFEHLGEAGVRPQKRLNSFERDEKEKAPPRPPMGEDPSTWEPQPRQKGPLILSVKPPGEQEGEEGAADPPEELKRGIIGRPSEVARSRRMVGAMFGHLRKAKTNLEKESISNSRKKLTEAQQKAEAREREHKKQMEMVKKMEVEEMQKQRKVKLEDIERKIAEKDAEILKKKLTEHYRSMTNFIRTTTCEPCIFYIPKKHNEKTEALLENTKKTLEGKIATLDEEILPAYPSEEEHAAAAAASSGDQVPPVSPSGGDQLNGHPQDAFLASAEEAEEPREQQQEQEQEEASSSSAAPAADLEVVSPEVPAAAPVSANGSFDMRGALPEGGEEDVEMGDSAAEAEAEAERQREAEKKAAKERTLKDQKERAEKEAEAARQKELQEKKEKEETEKREKEAEAARQKELQEKKEKEEKEKREKEAEAARQKELQEKKEKEEKEKREKEAEAARQTELQEQREKEEKEKEQKEQNEREAQEAASASASPSAPAAAPPSAEEENPPVSSSSSSSSGLTAADVERMTVVVLKEELKKRNEKTAGKKAELQQRLLQCLGLS